MSQRFKLKEAWPPNNKSESTNNESESLAKQAVFLNKFSSALNKSHTTIRPPNSFKSFATARKGQQELFSVATCFGAAQDGQQRTRKIANSRL